VVVFEPVTEPRWSSQVRPDASRRMSKSNRVVREGSEDGRSPPQLNPVGRMKAVPGQKPRDRLSFRVGRTCDLSHDGVHRFEPSGRSGIEERRRRSASRARIAKRPEPHPVGRMKAVPGQKPRDRLSFRVGRTCDRTQMVFTGSTRCVTIPVEEQQGRSRGQRGWAKPTAVESCRAHEGGPGAKAPGPPFVQGVSNL